MAEHAHTTPTPRARRRTPAAQPTNVIPLPTQRNAGVMSAGSANIITFPARKLVASDAVDPELRLRRLIHRLAIALDFDDGWREPAVGGEA